MLKIAITGNIASGKSLFEKYLLDILKTLDISSQFEFLCLDEVTKKLYNESHLLKDFLLKKFNTPKKEEVAKIVFNDVDKLKELENFIYPIILDEMNTFFKKNSGARFAFVSVPMLFESGFNKYFDKIIFIKADRKIRLKRLIKRNNLTEKEAVLRLDAQMDENLKIPFCDFVVDNSNSKEFLKEEAKKVIKALNIL